MGPMKLYADVPAVRRRQILGDVLVIGWILLWVWIGFTVHDVVSYLAVPGAQIESAAGGVAEAFGNIAQSVSEAPLVGDALSAPFEAAEASVSDLAAAGRSQQQAAARLARWVAAIVVVLPLATALIFWLPRRVRWIRSVAAAGNLSDDPALFAIRALVNRPIPRLLAVSPAPGLAVIRGDESVIADLAALELAAMGLRPPPE